MNNLKNLGKYTFYERILKNMKKRDAVDKENIDIKRILLKGS